MNTAYTLIRRHCHNQLVERGWPDDLDIETNLSYCQGDGVAFYGRIHTYCILKLLPELAGRGYLSEQDWREMDNCIGESNLNIVLSRNSLANHYAHAGTITLEYEDWPETMSEPLMRRLLAALRREINDLCGSVAADGYRLMEAINPSWDNAVIRHHRTPNFTVTITEVEPAGGYGLPWDEELQDSCLEAILNEGATLRTLEVSVTCARTGHVYGQSVIPDVMRHPGQPWREWFERDWVRDAVTEARREISETLNAFASFRRAA
ncbi:hypothetical protein E7W39_04005 [Cronobacter sakazakii]|uniref:hypothetical protein n=1 Tax=Cronobacter TaxID=413496 RepID=UPI000B3DDE69|nr:MULTISPECIES: hypothetical protein [Cronobacter]EIZ2183948.1 hypothetical protein [Cronobacter sakazakii]EIZ2214108.1 hypothetical protein [Cronobacter sakazakii]EIZ2217972.1 hypothetical protein [Cronobacter sakazakii]EIZ2222934.1 hypothetical protein [Cronobacter sakazakii]EIZ2227130.1 hypothetical protein [Cronobacter sakazakii]